MFLFQQLNKFFPIVHFQYGFCKIVVCVDYGAVNVGIYQKIVVFGVVGGTDAGVEQKRFPIFYIHRRTVFDKPVVNKFNAMLYFFIVYAIVDIQQPG